jgi:hypothetical protein
MNEKDLEGSCYGWSRYYTGICLEGMEKEHENLSQDSKVTQSSFEPGTPPCTWLESYQYISLLGDYLSYASNYFVNY